MTEKWDHNPTKRSAEDIDRLIAQKSDATVGDALRSVPHGKLSAHATEKWDYNPSKNSPDDIDRLIARKPDATVGDALRGIPIEEFSPEQLENFKKERDALVMDVIMMQKDIDNLGKVLKTTPRYHPERASLENRLEELESSRIIENGKITQLETLLAKHRPLRN